METLHKRWLSMSRTGRLGVGSFVVTALICGTIVLLSLTGYAITALQPTPPPVVLTNEQARAEGWPEEFATTEAEGTIASAVFVLTTSMGHHFEELGMLFKRDDVMHPQWKVEVVTLVQRIRNGNQHLQAYTTDGMDAELAKALRATQQAGMMCTAGIDELEIGIQGNGDHAALTRAANKIEDCSVLVETATRKIQSYFLTH